MEESKSLRNVLLLMDDSLPESTSMGGLAEHVRNLIKGFSDEYFFYIVGKNNNSEWVGGSRFQYMEISDSPFVVEESFEGDTDVMKQLLFDQFSRFEFIVSEFKKMEDVEIDIVHTCDWSTGLAGKYLANYFDAKLLSAFHLSFNASTKPEFFSPNVDEGYFRNKYDLFSMVSTIEDTMIKSSDFVTVVSESYRQRLCRSINNYEVVPNGINVGEMLSGKKVDVGNIDGAFKLLYIGRLADQKGLGELFRCTIPKEVELIIAGDDTKGGEQKYYDMVHDYSNAYENITYIGRIDGQDKYNLLASVDGIIMPSKHEPFGIVALEALASRTPLITTAVDGLSDFLEDNSYIQCDLYPSSIERAIDKLVLMSEDKRKSMTMKGSFIARKYSWDNVRKQYKNIYDKL